MWPGVGENFWGGPPPQDNSVGSGEVWVTGLFSLCLQVHPAPDQYMYLDWSGTIKKSEDLSSLYYYTPETVPMSSV